MRRWSARKLPRTCSNENGQPKFRYATRAEAKAVARRLGEDRRVYRCGHCNYFHVAHRKDAVDA